MLFSPSFVRQQNFKAIFGIAQAFLIITLLVKSHQAGVIKKRDVSELTTIASKLSQNDQELKAKQLAPTILTALNNESDNVTTKLKLQPVNSITDHAPELSKELSYNEISLNEAKKLLEQKLKSSTQNQSLTLINETEFKTELKENLKELELNENYKNSFTKESELNEKSKENSELQLKNVQDSFSKSDNEVKTITEDSKLNSESKKPETVEKNLVNTAFQNHVATTTEFSSNIIAEEKLQKTKEPETNRETEATLDSSKLSHRFKQLDEEDEIEKTNKEQETFRETEAKLDSSKLSHRFKQLDVEDEMHTEHANSMENSLKSIKEKPRPPSQILAELKIDKENEEQSTKSEHQTNEHIEDQLMQETTESKTVLITESPKEQSENIKTFETFSNKDNLSVNSSLKEHEQNAEMKILETSANETQTQLESVKDMTKSPEEKPLETFSKSITAAGTAEDTQNVKDTSNTETSLKQPFNSSHEDHSNTIQDGLDREELFKSSKIEIQAETSTDSEKQNKNEEEEDSSIFDINKTEHARSMFRESLEEATTLQSNNDNEILTTTSSPKTIKLSIKDSFKEGNTETTKEATKESDTKEPTKESDTKETTKESDTKETTKESDTKELVKESKEELAKEELTKETKEVLAKEFKEDFTKERDIESFTVNSKEFSEVRSEKKPKFINDNSTNAQQLNLPNNMDVWSLASMKTLPKANVTIETEQNHTTDIKEEPIQNNSFTITSNSEKNLLDWSSIMKDKELSTTTRNQNFQQLEEEDNTDDNEKEKLENQLTNEENKQTTIKEEELLEKENGKTTTTTITPEQTLNQPKIESREDITNIQTDFSSTTIMPNFTILSANENDNNNEEDKRTITPMNNHIETHTTLPTKSPIELLNNNPFNATKNIEPNLTEINLTSKSTHLNINADDDDELHITTSTGKPTEYKDVNVDINVATERATKMTEATAGTGGAVVDMTTLEQNSIELTTLSTLETGKQNASIVKIGDDNDDVKLKKQQQTNNNVILEESLEKSEKSGEKFEKSGELNKFENIATTTSSDISITTYRPKYLATTTVTPPPPLFKQEIDQIGNDILTNLTANQHDQKQSITALEINNNSKTIETHLNEELIIETTTATLETLLNETEKQENKLTLLENSTSSSKDDDDDDEEKIINEQTITKLDVTTEKALEAATTLKTVDDDSKVEVTTIGSPVIETKFEKPEKEDKEGKEDIDTTTQKEDTLTTTTTVIPKTPVVIIETQGSINNESSSIKPSLEEDITVINEEERKENSVENETTTMASSPLNTTTMNTKEDETLIKLLDDTTTSTTTTTTETVLSAISSTLNPTTISSSFSTTSPSPITTKIEEIYKVIHTSTTETIETTTSQLITETTEEESPYSSSSPIDMLPTSPSTTTMLESADIGKSLPTLTSIMGGVNSGNMYPKNSEASGETDVNVIIAITVSVIGVVALILLVGFLYLMRKRQKQTVYGQRCVPVSLDEYTIDNMSVGGSMRKPSALRSSKRTYGNLAFDDPSLRHNAMGVHELSKFVQEKLRIFEEFRDVPQVTARLDEVPQGCEDKNRYANVLPLPETRVILQRLNDDDKTEYINANYVTGPKDPPNYYIACQAPLDTTVEDFWRMIWEQQSRVIIQATDLIENGVEKCAEYLPPSVTLDNHSTFGDFQITLQNREVKDKYAISTILLKNVAENVSRELTHYWYKWPEVGVPAEEAPIIAMLLEARSSLISYAIEQANEDKEKSSFATLKSAEEGLAAANGTATSPSKDSNGSSANGSNGEINGNISMVHIKKTARNQGPLTIHCSPGTGRTGTIIACDIAIRSLETPKRIVDIPQIVFYVRRGRASAVLTKEQYEFIYKVANMYAAKISNPTNYN